MGRVLPHRGHSLKARLDYLPSPTWTRIGGVGSPFFSTGIGGLVSPIGLAMPNANVDAMTSEATRIVKVLIIVLQFFHL